MPKSTTSHSLSIFFFFQLYAGTKMRRNSTYKAATPTNRTLLLPTLQLLLLVASSVGVSAQCPWQRDVPDLQTSCICAYNLGRELSVQCDQVSKV